MGQMESVSQEGKSIKDPCVFVSHSHLDDALASTFTDYLLASFDIKSDRIRCTSQPGHEVGLGIIPSSLVKDLQESCVVFMLATKSGQASSWVQNEIGVAHAFGKKIVPILPASLAGAALDGFAKHFLDVNAANGKVEAFITSIINSVCSDNGFKQKPPGRATQKLKKFLEELEKEPTVSPDYCPLSLAFGDRTRDQKKGNESLVSFQTYFDVGDNKELSKAQEAIKGFFENRGKGDIHYPTLWSLLGSMEMLVTFRASSYNGKQLQEALRSHIEVMDVPSVTIRDFELYATSTSGIPIRRHSRQGDVLQACLSLKNRAAHTFSLNWNIEKNIANPETAINRIQTMLTSFNQDLRGGEIELFAFSPCKKHVLIDLHLPCGRIDIIKQLSKKLKTELGYWNKDTFIVYDMERLDSPTQL